MIPEEVTYTFKHVCMASFNFKRTNPMMYVGEIEIIDLDNKGARSTIKYERYAPYAKDLEKVNKEINFLWEHCHPEEPGKKPPPTIEIKVAIEFDRSLRFIEAKEAV